MIFGKKKGFVETGINNRDVFRMALFILLLPIFLINFSITSSFGITQSFSPTGPSGDGYIYSQYTWEYQPGDFDGNDLKAGCEAGNNQRTLLFFDISSLPPNATISDARLFMRLNKSDDILGSRNISLYWVNQEWDSANGNTNWFYRMIGSNKTWIKPGGDYYSSYVLDTISVDQTIKEWKWQGNLKNAVLNWHAQPSENFGLILLTRQLNSVTYAA